MSIPAVNLRGLTAVTPSRKDLNLSESPPRSRPRVIPIGRIALVVALIAAAVAITWRMTTPISVTLVRPEVREITESIAASGIVTGRREAQVGARIPGVVSELLVREGDRVAAGQLIARISNEVANAQVDQARQAVNTAHAQLRQTAVRPRRSELEAASARVRQAEAQLGEVLPQIERAELGVTQAESAVDQALANAERARANVRQVEARRDLAAKTAARYRTLHDEGAISAHSLDQVVAELTSAEADKAVAEQAVKVTDLAAESARAAVKAAGKEVDALRTRAVAANAALSAAQADFRTVEAGPRFEAVEAAREHTYDAEKGVEVAKTQARMSDVRAPFAGTVTDIETEIGVSVGPEGIVRLVEDVEPEIRLSVDENNLSELRAGQRAVITSSAFRNVTARGRVVRISSRVDSARGTVEVAVAPEGPTGWLRPGQTVNVNVVLSERSRKVVVPASAIRQEAGRSVVLKVVDGSAVPHQVDTGPARDGVIPVLRGLNENELIILKAENVKTGARVRAGK